MSAEDRTQEIFRRHLECWRAGDLPRVDEIVGPGYVGHVSAGDRDKAGLVERVAVFRTLYPDIVFTVEDQIALGDKVVTRMTAQGTHQPTGQATVLIGMNISRIVEGKIAEEWAVWEPCKIR
jgi:predicted SnoaL-like aldol condensation-catalyzing enzyme